MKCGLDISMMSITELYTGVLSKEFSVEKVNASVFQTRYMAPITLVFSDGNEIGRYQNN